jgi:hypothetical protein
MKKEGSEETGGKRDNEEFSSSFSSLEKLGFDITEKLFHLPNPSGTNETLEQTTKEVMEAGHSTPVKKVSQPQTPAKVSQGQTPAPVSKGTRKPGAMFGEDYFMKLLQASPERPPAASARGDKNNEDDYFVKLVAAEVILANIRQIMCVYMELERKCKRSEPCCNMPTWFCQIVQPLRVPCVGPHCFIRFIVLSS